MSLYDELATIAHTTFESVTHNVIVSIGNENSSPLQAMSLAHLTAVRNMSRYYNI
jgi:hypothetical protein